MVHAGSERATLLRDAVETDSLPWHADTFCQFLVYIMAVAMWCYETNASITGIEHLMAAVSMALRVNSITIPLSFGVSVIKAAVRRTCGQPVKKRRGLGLDEAVCINTVWGVEGASLANQMMSFAMCIRFCCLLRFSSLMVIVVGGIYWIPSYHDESGECQLGGCIIILMRGKMDQVGTTNQVVLANMGRTDSIISRLCALCGRLGSPIPVGHKGFVHSWCFLFCDMKCQDGRKHRKNWIYDIDMCRVQPMASGGLVYDHYLTWFHQAIEECCRYM